MSGVEVGTAFVTVLPSTRGFHQALSADVDKAAKSAGASGGRAAGGAFTAGFGKAAAGIGAGLVAAFSARAVVSAIGTTIGAASDLAESQSKIKVVFGQSATAINQWAESSATSLLMSRQAALEAAGTYGNLFQAFGIGQSKAQEMSTTLVQLAADLASFNNTSVEDAILALRSGLSGETEPLKRYGVALTDARLKSEAMALGIYDGVGILDAAQKAQASYSLILKDTTLAQGDVERTADGYANTVRSLQAAVDNASASIGKGFVDGITAASKSMGGPDGIVTLVDRLADGLANTSAGAGAALSALGGLEAGKVSSLTSREETSFWKFLDNPKTWTGPWAALGHAVGIYGENTRISAAKQEALAAELERSAYMQDVYAGKTQSSAVEMSAAATAAQNYDTYLQSMTDRTVAAATGVETLGQALQRFNSQNGLRNTGVAIRDQWRALDTMGDKRTVKVKVKNPNWKPGSSAQEFITKTKSVQDAFDPTVRGGRLGTDASGDKARQWATVLADRYLARAEALGGQEGEDLLARGRRRLGRQFDEWGISRPRDYAASFIRTPASLVTQNNLNANALDPANVSDESRRMGTTTVMQFSGDILVSSKDAFVEVQRQARRQAAHSRVPHGAARTD